MYQAFTFKELAFRIGLLIAVFALVNSYFHGIHSLGSVWTVAASAATQALLIMWLIGETPAFREIWKLQLIQKLMFPYIEGNYTGTITSNWELISSIRSSASGAGGMNLDEASMQKCSPSTIDVEVEIKASWLTAVMKLTAKSGYSKSLTFYLHPDREGPDGLPRLSYLYRANNQVPHSTDEQFYHGAGYLDVKKIGDRITLDGVYWTNRKWADAMNTAGAIKLTKSTVDKDSVLLSYIPRSLKSLFGS
jgi:hypothetical protein